MPAAADDPFAGLCLGHGGLDQGEDLIPVLDLHQLESQLGLADAREVDMGINESRNRQLPLQIDHLGRITDISLDVFRIPHGHDDPSPHGQGLRLRQRVMHGHDLAVGQDQVRSLLLGSA
jgi:hypothetical protein